MSQLLASDGAGSAVPGSVATRPSKIWRETRKVSPSEAKKGSRLTGSAEPANTKVPPPDELDSSSRWLSAQPASASEATRPPITPRVRNRIRVDRTTHLACHAQVSPEDDPSTLLMV